MKISEFFEHDFKNGDFKLFDKNCDLIFNEVKQDDKNEDGFWSKYIRIQGGLCSYVEFSNGYWQRLEYNKYGQVIKKECSDGYWWKQEYDSNGNETVYTCSDDKHSAKLCD